MTKRIIAITFIFLCASVAWAILGGTIFTRTYSLDAVAENRVASTWGTSQNQSPPKASFTTFVPKQEETTENGKKIVKTTQQEVTTTLPLESSLINVALDLEHRQKGLLWYNTYKVDFSGMYGFRNTSSKEETVNFTLSFPTTKAIYDNLVFTVDGLRCRLPTKRIQLPPQSRYLPVRRFNSVLGIALKGWTSGAIALGRTSRKFVILPCV